MLILTHKDVPNYLSPYPVLVAIYELMKVLVKQSMQKEMEKPL